MRVSRDGVFLLALFVVLVLGIALFVQPNSRPVSDVSTTYSAAPNGVKAFYTLLGDRLGYNVDRFEHPYTELPKRASMLVVVNPLVKVPIDDDEADALRRWVESGRTVIFVSDSLKGVPEAFMLTRRMGKGHVYSMDSLNLITNRGVRDYRNAMKVLGKVQAHARPRDLILFDEYHHGLGASKTQALLIHTQPQVKVGAALIVIALASLCYGRGRRFGAVRNLPKSQSLRPEFEFVESVARLYDRAGAADVAADILTQDLRQNLCRMLGQASDAPTEAIVRQIASEGHEQAARRVSRLLEAQAGQKLSKSELVFIAGEINAVEKELGLGEVNA